jgi:pimeloyl-ACP methyl ester carboxylesterase
VLLLHGLGSSRATMFARASFLAARGHAVLAIDHRAHGESEGARISFGRDEARDVSAALSWLRAAGHARVAVIGFSLGGAAALLAEPPITVDAIVLEAVYVDIRDAVHARIAARAGRLLADLSAPLLVQVAALRLAIHPSRFDVLAAAGRIRAPALLIAGERDRRAPVEAMQRLRAALPAARELLVITGADHQDFFAFDREDYAARVGAFLAETLN